MNRLLVPLSIWLLGAIVSEAEAAPASQEYAHERQKRGGGGSNGGRSSRPASRPASQPASRPASQPASRPASQPASRPASGSSDSRSQDSRSQDSRSQDSRSQDSRSQDSRSQDSRSQDSRSQGEQRHEGRESGADRPDARSPGRPGEVRPTQVGNAPINARPVGPRQVEFGAGTQAANHRGAAPPANYREAASRSNASPASRSHAEATARSHRDAAYAGRSAVANDPRRGQAASHRNASARAHTPAAYHQSYAARHQQSRWNRPNSWFTRWHPGRPSYWYHGVFVYGPAPWAPAPPPGRPRATAPERVVERDGDFSVGVRGSTYASAYRGGQSFSDLGLGLAARYRISDPIGLEVQWVYHDDSWSDVTERIEQPLSGSVQLFGMPWARVNPYLSAGVTLTKRNYQDKVGGAFVDETRSAWGPHVGLGLELNLSEKASLSLDGRYLGYVNLQPDDAARAGALQGNLGLNLYF